MRWKRIKLTDKDPASVEIGYQLAVSGGYVDHLVTSPEAPHPDFVQAMAAIAGAVLDIAEIEDVADLDDITVRGVNFAHHKNGRVGVVITALRKLERSSAPLLINTPHKILSIDPADGSDSDDDDEVLAKDVAARIDVLCAEARAFIIDGKRAQGDLFQKPEPKPNGRRPRTEDWFQGEQPELEMGSGVGDGTSLEELNENVEREASSGDLSAIFDGVSTRVADNPAENGDRILDRVAFFNDSPQTSATAAQTKEAALEQVQSWLDYKEYCFTFGIKPTRVDFSALMATRDPTEQRAGYRDPQLAKEREEARLAARTGSTPVHAGSNNDDDLLS